MSLKIEPLISEEEINNRISEIADKINADFSSEKDLILICILKGSIMFLTDLSKKLKQSIEFEFMDVSSYWESCKSSGKVTLLKDIEIPLEGKDVLIVEDIVDTGRTLNYLKNYISKKNPSSLKICTLLDKPECRVAEITPDYIGFTIPDAFVVGYGLDYKQKYRNLPYIGILHIS